VAAKFYKASNLKGWWAKYNKGSPAKQLGILCWGDSVVFGVGSDGVFGGAGEEKNQWQNSWVALTRAAIAAKTGVDPGPGFIALNDATGRVELSGGPLHNDMSPVQVARELTSSKFFKIVKAQMGTWRYLDVISYWNGASELTEPITVKLDEGAAVEKDHGAEIADGYAVDTFDAGSLAEHFAEIKGKLSGKPGILAGVVPRKTDTGVLVHRAGVKGNSTRKFFGQTGSFNPATPWDKATKERVVNSLLATGADLLVFMGPTNDMGEGASSSPTILKENLDFLLDIWEAKGKHAVLLTDPAAPVDGSPSTEADYWTAYMQLCNEHPQTAASDVKEWLGGTYAASKAAGYQAEEVHPTKLGHEKIANELVPLLTEEQEEKMAEVKRTPDVPTASGLEPTVIEGMNTADVQIIANKRGNVLLSVKNESAEATEVTIITPNTVNGNAIADKVVSVPASKTRKIGPFAQSTYNNKKGNLEVKFSKTTSIKLEVTEVTL